MRKIDTLIIHCAATKPSMDIGKKEITQWHKQRGFFNIGYHYVIRRDGTLEMGRKPEEVGAHATGHNMTSLGICLVGGIDEKGKPQCNFTYAQWMELKRLVNVLVERYGALKIIGHNEVDNKACPSFSVPKWLAGHMEPMNK